MVIQPTAYYLNLAVLLTFSVREVTFNTCESEKLVSLGKALCKFPHTAQSQPEVLLS